MPFAWRKEIPGFGVQPKNLALQEVPDFLMPVSTILVRILAGMKRNILFEEQPYSKTAVKLQFGLRR